MNYNSFIPAGIFILQTADRSRYLSPIISEEHAQWQAQWARERAVDGKDLGMPLHILHMSRKESSTIEVKL